jgi:hypothetical protein|tara:strand:- start:751 stop:1203 length:453 start_codon:yes stop_codon:yes gene_type:complete
MSAPHGPGPEEGRGVAARLVYDPNIATVSEETFNELIAIMRITVTIIDGGERQLFNQPLFSGLATCKPGPHFGDLAPLCCHHFGREAAHGGIAAIFQFDFSHRDRAFMMGNHRAHKIGVGIAREGYVHIAVHLGIRGPVGPRSGRLVSPA